MGGHLRAAELAAVVDHVLLGDFLEREEPVALGAVIDEYRFEGGLYAGDDSLVDVALALFLARGFDVEVDELLAVDDGDPELLGLGRVEQHAFHCCLLPRSDTEDGPRSPGPRRRVNSEVDSVLRHGCEREGRFLVSSSGACGLVGWPTLWWRTTRGRQSAWNSCVERV